MSVRTGTTPQFHAARECREHCRQSARFAEEIARRDAERLPGLDVQRPASLERARPDFRAAEILQNRHFARHSSGRGSDAAKRRRLRLMSAV